LLKYYATDYQDLTILRLEGEDMGGNTNYKENSL